METERLTITIPEFARLCGISRNQAYSLAASDKLGVPVLRFGKRLCLPRSAVLRLLNGEGNEVGNCEERNE
jgi:predicted DNA-binding transcriptional regulator AlpA